MTVAIMQPYFFPYLGYWQMFSAVDKFVLLDDVNFIMRGYINRNSILANGTAHLFTIPLEKPSRNKLINEMRLSFDDNARNCFLKMLTCAYGKAPYYSEIFPIMEKVATNREINLVLFLKRSFELVKEYLGLSTEILVSSEIKKDASLKAQDRILAINKALGSTHYINAIGGQALYNRDDFEREGVRLNFIEMLPCVYKQFQNEFVPNLSMIDVLMFNSKSEIRGLLAQYRLI